TLSLPSARRARSPGCARVPYTTLFRSSCRRVGGSRRGRGGVDRRRHSTQEADRGSEEGRRAERDRAAARLGELRRDHQRVQEERSEEHTSELQSPDHLVCRLLLEKKKD